MFLISKILRNEQFLIFLVLSSSVQSYHRPNPKFVNVGGIASDILTATETIGKDLNNIYTGWVESSFLYPYYLKGSSYVNTFYGQVNRTGLLVAGAALLGVSGVIFLGELNALPSLESMAEGVRDVEGIMNNVLKGTFQFTPFRGTASDSFDRADVVHDMPGPPYNYDIEAVMNLTSKNFEENKHRKNGNSGGDFTTIDKYFEHPSKVSTGEEKTSEKKLTNEEIIEPHHPYQPGFTGQNKFRNEKPKRYVIAKNNGKKYLYNRVKNKYSPKGFSYERRQYPKKYPVNSRPFKRKPFRRKRFSTVPPFQNILQSFSGSEGEEEWKGILGLVGL